MPCRLTGKWSIEALEVGWNQLLERHESLRTTILEQEGEPFQQVQSHVFRHIPQTNLTDLSLEDREREMKRLIQNEAEEPFHFGRYPSDSNTNIESGQGRMGSHLYDASYYFRWMVNGNLT